VYLARSTKASPLCSPHRIVASLASVACVGKI
jgi:hypothetical protein